MALSLTDAEVLELADLNLAESAREMARWRSHYEIEESDDLLLVASVDPFPVGYGNAAMVLGTTAPRDPEAITLRSKQFFADRGRGFTLWTRAHLDEELAAHAGNMGLSPLFDSPGMVLDSRLEDVPAAEGVRVAQVTNAGMVEDLADVVSAAYSTVGLPPASAAAVYAEPQRVLRPHIVSVLGYLQDRPVSTATAILSNGIAGLYWVGTTEEARGRGLGEACTRLAGNLAFDRGASCVVLQASKQGDPVYRRMGYREITRYTWHVCGPRGS